MAAMPTRAAVDTDENALGDTVGARCSSIGIRRARRIRVNFIARLHAAILLAGISLQAYPASAPGTTLTFQDGVNGYTGTVDTFLQQSAPNTNRATQDRGEWDSDDPAGTGFDNYGLIRFDGIFGGAAGQIPAGAQITSATLTYDVINVGDPASVYEISIPWSESVTYNTFGGTPGLQPSEFGAYVTSAPGSVLGTQIINVTNSLITWSNNPSANHGWIFVGAGTNGVEYRSRENSGTTLRPKLTVTFNEGAPAVALVRQPYLQRGASGEMTVAWRTNIPSSSRVRFGLAPAQLTGAVIDNEPVVDHFITITGLNPDTRYYYDAGTAATVLAGAATNQFFKTSPPTGARAAFSAWVLGDSGNGSTQQTAVRDAMLSNTGANLPDLFLHVGDIAYDTGTDAEFTARFFAPYQNILRHTVCWPAIGNHEGGSSASFTQAGPYYTAYALPTGGESGGLPSGTEAYYAFDYGNAHFIALDSHDSSRAPGSPMLTWLAADLAATDKEWIIAFWHHPPYSKGTHDSDDTSSDLRLFEMRTYVLPILEAGGVDLVLAGHSHIYERSYLLSGAYDTPTTAAGHIMDGGNGRIAGDGAYHKSLNRLTGDGAVYVVAGHGGASVGGTGGHPVMYFSEIANGSCILTLSGDLLTMRNIRYDGVVTDTFAISKVPGDINGDGIANTLDLAPFVAVLLELDASIPHRRASDLNGDGAADGDDIAGFVSAIAPP